MALNLDDALWSFATARYTVAFFAEDEDMHPRDGMCFEKDIEYACEGGSHWFHAIVAVFNEDSEVVGRDDLGGCSYGSFREFYSSHRWQYSRRQGKWITDPRSRAWKACEARRPRREDGSRMDGGYFTDMVRAALAEARSAEIRRTMVAA